MSNDEGKEAPTSSGRAEEEGDHEWSIRMSSGEWAIGLVHVLASHIKELWGVQGHGSHANDNG
ncbi:MAG: hypothetical protein KGI73_00770 [Patescibacteria group bacterium]|nr:hypothetical protein [Patescibacteria group bacterium]